MELAVVLAPLALALPVPTAAATPPDAELVTVTDRGFTATWTTAETSDTTVCVGPADGAPQCQTYEQGVRFHYAEVGGLEPGRRYSYTLRSAGAAEPLSSTNPGAFTTLVPPPGEHLFDFVLLSDTHVGEECSGTATTLPAVGSVPPCFKTEPGDPGHPYAATMSRAAVEEVNARRPGIALLNADQTSHAKYEEVAEFRGIFQALTMPWYAARGAHDRAGQNAPDARCGADNDCFRELVFTGRPAGRIFYSFDYRDHHFVALDSVSSTDGTGDIDAAQLEVLRSDLDRARERGQRTFIFFHHPVSEYANTTAFPPVIFGVRPTQGGTAFLELVARYPNVVAVLNSHTHRNYVSYSPRSGVGLPFIENGPVKEYPGGYGVFRVHTGGYSRNFHRLRCQFCREWTSTTRDEYFGLYPLYTLGTLSARSFTHVYDCSLPTPPPSPPFGNESGTGGDTLRSTCPAGASGGQRTNCATATGRLRGTRLGPARLGRRRQAQRRMLPPAVGRRGGVERYCLSDGSVLRIGYPSRGHIRDLRVRLHRPRRSSHSRHRGRVALALSSSRRYSYRGVRPGTRVRTLHRRLGRLRPALRARGVTWYAVRKKPSTVLFKATRGRVREIGLAHKRFVPTRKSARRFLRRFGRNV